MLNPQKEEAARTLQIEQEASAHVSTAVPSGRAQIYASELEYIKKCILDCPGIETGGQLFGAWTASGTPRIIYAIGPGPRANHEAAFFNQDVQYLERIGAKLKEFGLQHIGEWHSHHHLGLPRPSGHDARTMQNGVEQSNLSRLCLCIGGIDASGRVYVNPFNFIRGGNYADASWDLINVENKLRSVIDESLAAESGHPHSYHNATAGVVHQSQNSGMNEIGGWFSDKHNRLQFKQIIEWLQNKWYVQQVRPQINGDKVQLVVSGYGFNQLINFPNDYPDSPFVIEHTPTSFGYYQQSGAWGWEHNTKGSVFEAFVEQYNKFMEEIYGRGTL